MFSGFLLWKRKRINLKQQEYRKFSTNISLTWSHASVNVFTLEQQKMIRLYISRRLFNVHLGSCLQAHRKCFYSFPWQMYTWEDLKRLQAAWLILMTLRMLHLGQLIISVQDQIPLTHISLYFVFLLMWWWGGENLPMFSSVHRFIRCAWVGRLMVQNRVYCQSNINLFNITLHFGLITFLKTSGFILLTFPRHS